MKEMTELDKAEQEMLANADKCVGATKKLHATVKDIMMKTPKYDRRAAEADLNMAISMYKEAYDEYMAMGCVKCAQVVLRMAHGASSRRLSLDIKG